MISSHLLGQFTWYGQDINPSRRCKWTTRTEKRQHSCNISTCFFSFTHSRTLEFSGLDMGEKHDVVESGPGVLSSDSSATVELERKGPPNGGSKAWLQVLGAFFLYFNTWGKEISYKTQFILALAPLLTLSRNCFQLWELPELLRRRYSEGG